MNNNEDVVFLTCPHCETEFAHICAVRAGKQRELVLCPNWECNNEFVLEYQLVMQHKVYVLKEG